MISLEAAAVMLENGLDWKGVFEKLLVSWNRVVDFLNLDYIDNLMSLTGEVSEEGVERVRFNICDKVGTDPIDHVRVLQAILRVLLS